MTPQKLLSCANLQPTGGDIFVVLNHRKTFFCNVRFVANSIQTNL